MTGPIIHLTHQAEVKLTAWSIVTQGREFSGLGLIEKEGNILHAIDVDLLGVGTMSYTEFSAERQRMLPLDPRRKLWLHRHPVGDGKPGPHNWSGRDNRTAEQEPLGGIPQLVQWSCSIVLTPGGWVGRVDFYLPKLRTYHCAVEPSNPSEAVVIEATNLIDPDMRDYAEQLLREFEAQQRRNMPRIPQEYSYADFGFEDAIYGDMFCPECGYPLIELGTEDVSGIMDVTIFECQEGCGGFFTLTDHHSCTELVQQQSKPQPKPKQSAWRQTGWWNWGKKK